MTIEAPEQVEDTRPILNPASSLVVDELVQLRQEVVAELKQLSERGGEQPGMFNIWPEATLTSQRIRAEKLVISVIAGAPISLGVRVGESTERRLRLSDGTTELDFTRIIQSGQRVDLIDLATGAAPTAAQLLDAWITGFTE